MSRNTTPYGVPFSAPTRHLTASRAPASPRTTTSVLLALAVMATAQQATTEQDSVMPVHAMPDTTVDSTTLADSSYSHTQDSAGLGQEKSTLTDTVYYEADVIRYDLKNRIIHLQNNAMTRYEDVTLYADTIVYRIDGNLFVAVGTPRLEEAGDVTVGEYLTYNIKTRRGTVRYATTQMTEEYFTGQQIVKSAENHLYIDEGDYTTCAYLEHPHYYFYGKNLKVIPKDKAVSRPVVLNIGEAPVAIFPYYIMPLEKGRRSGWLTPGWGGHPTRGGYLDNIGYYWVPNDYMDFMLSGKVQEFNDLVLTGRARYARRYWLNGGLTGSYHIGTDIRTTSSEWTLDFSHDQKLLPDGSLALRGSGRLSSAKVNDRTFYQSYSENPSEIIRQNLSANMELVKRIERLNTSVRVAWSRSQDLLKDYVTEDLPVISFGLSRPLIPHKPSSTTAAGEEGDEPRWYNNIHYSYNTVGKVKHVEYLNDSLPGYWRPGLTQSATLSSPQKLFKWFTINPSFTARHSLFYGYMDTARVLDRLHHDTLVYAADTALDPLDFARVDSFPLIDTLDDGTIDTLNWFARWHRVEADSIYRYDTTWDKLAHDASWQTGVSLSTTLYGLFPIKVFNLRGIRHTFTPAISYTFVPEHDQDKQFFNIGIPYDQARKRSQRIGLRFGNLFQGKTVSSSDDLKVKAKEKTFKMFNADLSMSYDFEAKNRKWSDIGLSASTRIKFMSISYSSSFWMYEKGNLGGKLSFPSLKQYSITITPNNFAIGGRFWGGDLLVYNKVQPDDDVEYAGAGDQQWRFSLTPSYSFSSSRHTPEDVFVPTKTYRMGASASLSFTRNWSVSWSSRYNFVTNEFESHSLDFRCNLECWDMIFNWTPAGVRPGYYYFKVNLRKIPDIKWEERP